MYVPSNNPKYTCYKCKNKIPTTDLEGVFQEQLRNFFLSPTEITGYLEQADSVMGEKSDLLKTLERDRQKAKSDMDRTYSLYLDGKLSSEGFGSRNTPLEARVKQLDDEIPRLTAEIDFLRIQYLSSGQIVSEAKDLYSRWPDLEPAEKRNLIEAITERIVIGDGDVAIDLCYVPPSPQFMTEGQRNFRGSSRQPA
jgi:site-specific DNA recombinase